MKEPVKTGIMGGTFNPIHMGHLMIGECAFEQFGLDQVMFMPSKIPPHKKQALLASEDDRRNMVELAIEDNPDFVLSTMELEREGTTYSVDTLKELTAQNRNRSIILFLVQIPCLICLCGKSRRNFCLWRLYWLRPDMEWKRLDFWNR